MNLPPNCFDDDILGRRISSEQKFKDLKKGRKGRLLSNFMPRSHENGISVDRLGHTSDEDMAKMANKTAVANKNSFYGWAAIEVRHAKMMDRQVSPSPVKGNRYHANIVLPSFKSDGEQERRDYIKEHARNLASYAQCREAKRA